MIRRTPGLTSTLLLALLTLNCSNPGPPPPEKPHNPPAYQITLDIVDPERIHGWAWDANNPDRPVTLVIYDGNDILATLVADDFRQDLLDAGKGNGRHAFDLPFPAELCDDREHLIHAEVAGESPMLEIFPRSVTCVARLSREPPATRTESQVSTVLRSLKLSHVVLTMSSALARLEPCIESSPPPHGQRM